MGNTPARSVIQLTMREHPCTVCEQTFLWKGGESVRSQANQRRGSEAANQVLARRRKLVWWIDYQISVCMLLICDLLPPGVNNGYQISYKHYIELSNKLSNILHYGKQCKMIGPEWTYRTVTCLYPTWALKTTLYT